MQIDSIDHSQWIRLEVMEVETLRFPSIKVAVDARFGEFTGRSTAWLETSALHATIRSLVKLDETRTGEATIDSMSPGELTISIKAIDAAGHLLLSASLLKRVHVGDKLVLVDRRLSGSFEIDPSSLHQVVSDFKNLAEGRQAEG